MSNAYLDGGIADLGEAIIHGKRCPILIWMRGLRKLGEAIVHGKSGHAAVAYEHSKPAGMHFKEIK